MKEKQSGIIITLSTTMVACSFLLLPIFLLLITTASPATAVRARGITAVSSLTSSQSYSSANEKQQEEEGVKKCKTEQGKDVDWFIAYKLPRIRTSTNPLVRAGLAYAYILPPAQATAPETGTVTEGENVEPRNISASAHKGSFFRGRGNSSKDNGIGTTDESRFSGAPSTLWTLSSKGIDSPQSMVGQTLGDLFVKGNQKVAFLTYNDQPPTGPVINTGAHSKGVIVSSLAYGGVWIQHSVPHFPLLDIQSLRYKYPATGKNNGQVFHCLSFGSAKDVDDLAKIFEITKPHVVNYSFPTEPFQKALPQFFDIVNRHHHYDQPTLIDQPNNDIPINSEATAEAEMSGEDPCLNEIDENACLNATLGQEAVKQGPNWDLMELRSAGGKMMRAFVKGPSFHEDVYSSWIASSYKSELEVQSWLNGPNPFPSNCSVAQLSVHNILNKSICGEEFSTHNDHSKWAISPSQEHSLVCISDLNRMEHQLLRGGVTVCFTDKSVWTTFNSSVIDVQPCPRFPTSGSSSDNDTSTGISEGTTSELSEEIQTNYII